MGHPRQERRKRELLALFERLGMRPQIRFGQNFLLDKNQVHYITRLGEITPADVVLEVGCGTGFLSQLLLEKGCTLLGVEYDRKLAGFLRERFQNVANFHLMEADILSGKNAINPEVLEQVKKLLAEKGAGGHLKCVSNLPYAAGTPFVANLFGTDLPWERAVFLLQYEVAQRLIASPGIPAYGSLSIVAALGGKVTIERRVPPQVFWPRPHVTSAVITIDFFSHEERLAIPWSEIRRICVAIFQTRRKRLRNSLKGLFPRDVLEEVLSNLGLSGEERGEDLSPECFLAFAREMRRLLPPSSSESSVFR